MSLVNANTFESFSDLENCYQRDVDFRVLTQITDSSVAIIAPHGGKIEPGTSEIAKGIAGDDFNFYLFEGLMSAHNYHCLHLTSSKFDDQNCLQLLQACEHVVSIHGCKGEQEIVYLGGLNLDLKEGLYQLLIQTGFQVECDHPKYLGASQRNVCNRGSTGTGVQIELTKALRTSESRVSLIHAIREYLCVFI